MGKRFVKSLLGIAVLVLFTSPLEMVGQSFKGSLVGGGTTSQIGGDNLSGFTKWGYFAGPSVSYPLKDKLDLTAQILYTKKGSKADNDEIGKDKILWEKLTLTYFEVPLFVEYEIQESLFLQGGLSPEYLLSAKTKARGEITTNLRQYSLNALGGARYQFTERVSGMARLSVSVIPIDKGPISANLGMGPNSPNDFQNRAANLVIKFGLRYSLGAL